MTRRAHMTRTTRTITRTAALLVTATLLATTACEKKEAVAAAKADQARAKAADGLAEAKRRYPEFLEAFAKSTDQTGFKVKGSIPAKSGEVDAWIEVKSVVGTSVAGPLVEAPKGTNHKKGDRVTISADRVKDWVYTQGGKSVGDFTAVPVEAPAPAKKK
jgi:uncharacterized protein YegJ (DUF2314 family)